MDDFINNQIWDVYVESKNPKEYPKNQGDNINREFNKPMYIETGVLDVLVNMDPKRFLELAYPMDVTYPASRKSIKWIKKNIRSDSPENMEYPFILLNDKFKIQGHEGRHRARSLIEYGIKEMPVLLKFRLYGLGYEKENYYNWFDKNKNRILNFNFIPERISQSKQNETVEKYLRKRLPKETKITTQWGVYGFDWAVIINYNYAISYENGKYIVRNIRDYGLDEEEKFLYFDNIQKVYQFFSKKYLDL